MALYRYWRETLAASPSNMHSRRYYLVSSVRGMEVLVHQCYWTSRYVNTSTIHLTGANELSPHSSYEEDAEVMRSYTFDLASETMTQKGGAAGMWLNGVMVQPVYNTHGVDWTKFTTYRPPTEFEAENGAYDAVVREHGKQSYWYIVPLLTRLQTSKRTTKCGEMTSYTSELRSHRRD